MGTAYNTNVVTDGLVACWDAGNRRSYPGAGTTWTDPVGGIKGTLENEDDDALNFNSFKGGYFEFDGTDGRVDCGDNLIVGWSEVSICVWALVENSGDTYPKLVSRAHAGCFDFAIGRSSSNYLFCYVNSSYINTPTDSMNDYYGKWTHYAMRWKRGTGDFRLYINGELEATGQRYYDTINDAGKYNLSFADRPTEGGGRALNGAMGPVYIYDRALSDDEIKQNYEATKSRFKPRITTDGLFASWDAGDPESYVGGTIWKDTANRFTGALVNGGDGSLNFDSANGGSLVFGGDDDYVGPIAIGDYSGTARSVIIWAAADDYSASVGFDDGILFNSASDKFSVSLGLSVGYFYFKSKMTHTSTYQGGIASTSLVNGSWHCWAVTINASDEIVAIYQDGESKTSAANNGWYFRDDTYIACRMNGSTLENPWNGKIGTVRLYTKTLSAAEVMDNYNKTKARFGH